MRTHRLLSGSALVLITAVFSACGKAADSWQDASAAYQAGEAAKASGDLETALKAFDFAAVDAAATPSQRYGALLGTAEVQARLGQVSAAEATFAKVQKDHADLLDVRGLRRMADAWIKAGQAEPAAAVVTAALARFPDQAEAFAKVRQGIDALKSGDAAALQELGYVGD
ncbi:MAG TPA: hypothetical protein VGC54_09805 [Planctomycetota bacterium]